MIAELGKDGEIFWNKMKQLEVEFYRMKIALADGSAELKEELSDLFETLRKVMPHYDNNYHTIRIIITLWW